MNNSFQTAVACFHSAKGIGKKVDWESNKRIDVEDLALMMQKLAIRLYNSGACEDPVVCRIQLMVEELSEYLQARTEIEAFDALIDLLYVTFGSFEVFGLPAAAGFEEVHRSNMSKAKTTGDQRLRDKGSEYSPPDLEGVLRRYRERLAMKAQFNTPDNSLQARKKRAELRRSMEENSDGSV